MRRPGGRTHSDGAEFPSDQHVFGFANANPKVFELALTNASKFVPNTYVGGSGSDGMVGALLGKLLSSGEVAPQQGSRPEGL